MLVLNQESNRAPYCKRLLFIDGSRTSFIQCIDLELDNFARNESSAIITLVLPLQTHSFSSCLQKCNPMTRREHKIAFLEFKFENTLSGTQLLEAFFEATRIQRTRTRISPLFKDSARDITTFLR